jgi:hypothetical protein
LTPTEQRDYFLKAREGGHGALLGVGTLFELTRDQFLIKKQTVAESGAVDTQVHDFVYR